ncbi:MAG: hypothetical protein K6A41_10400 [Bacteroidales bacterium]|nr:hypothetical protein [Bacteroidales bacterium]
MKKVIIFLFILTLIGNLCMSQTINDIGKITIGISMPEYDQNLNQAQMSRLQAKIEQMCHKNGVVTSFNTNRFFLRPSFDIFQNETVENGIQNIYVVEAELTISMVQDNGISFNSISKTLRGSGNTREKAINNCISNFTTDDNTFKSFLNQGKQRILDYYNSNCDQLLKKASTFAELEQYETAIAILMMVPESASCYQTILQKTEAIYKSYLNKECAQLTSAADAAIAVQDYHSAAEYLTQVNPNSNCYQSALKSFKKIEQKISSKEKKEWDFKMKEYNNSVQLQKDYLQAAKEIAVAYYTREPDIHIQQFIK